MNIEEKKARMRSYLSRVSGCEDSGEEVSDEDLRGFEMLVLDLQRRFLGLNLKEILWEILDEELP